MSWTANFPLPLLIVCTSRAVLTAADNISFHNINGRDNTLTMETCRHHAIEKTEKSLVHVQVLELQLGITSRWTPESAEFQNTARMVAMRTYQHALDVLEGLVVARLFELTSMNRSQMGEPPQFIDYTYIYINARIYYIGYKLRKHIGEALQKRSAAIRTALDRYNTAAKALQPPRPTLKWEDIMEYTLLSDFDLLRDARQNIREKPWSTPTGRLAMDQHFKVQRAREEIQRLNIEIKRVATHLRDEPQFLLQQEEALRATNPLIAHQVALYRKVRGRCASHHHNCLAAIARLRRFTGSIEPGRSLDTGPGGSASITMGVPEPCPEVAGDRVSRSREQEELAEEEEEDEADAEEGQDVLDILSVSVDRPGFHSDI